MKQDSDTVAGTEQALVTWECDYYYQTCLAQTQEMRDPE